MGQILPNASIYGMYHKTPKPDRAKNKAKSFQDFMADVMLVPRAINELTNITDNVIDSKVSGKIAGSVRRSAAQEAERAKGEEKKKALEAGALEFARQNKWERSRYGAITTDAEGRAVAPQIPEVTQVEGTPGSIGPNVEETAGPMASAMAKFGEKLKSDFDLEFRKQQEKNLMAIEAEKLKAEKIEKNHAQAIQQAEAKLATREATDRVTAQAQAQGGGGGGGAPQGSSGVQAGSYRSGGPGQSLGQPPKAGTVPPPGGSGGPRGTSLQSTTGVNYGTGVPKLDARAVIMGVLTEPPDSFPEYTGPNALAAYMAFQPKSAAEEKFGADMVRKLAYENPGGGWASSGDYVIDQVSKYMKNHPPVKSREERVKGRLANARNAMKLEKQMILSAGGKHEADAHSAVVGADLKEETMRADLWRKLQERNTYNYNTFHAIGQRQEKDAQTTVAEQRRAEVAKQTAHEKLFATAQMSATEQESLFGGFVNSISDSEAKRDAIKAKLTKLAGGTRAERRGQKSIDESNDLKAALKLADAEVAKNNNAAMRAHAKMLSAKIGVETYKMLSSASAKNASELADALFTFAPDWHKSSKDVLDKMKKIFADNADNPAMVELMANYKASVAKIKKDARATYRRRMGLAPEPVK